METATVDLHRLQLLNDRICQTIEALNQVRMSAQSSLPYGIHPSIPANQSYQMPVSPLGIPSYSQFSQPIANYGLGFNSIPQFHQGLGFNSIPQYHQGLGFNSIPQFHQGLGYQSVPQSYQGLGHQSVPQSYQGLGYQSVPQSYVNGQYAMNDQRTRFQPTTLNQASPVQW